MGTDLNKLDVMAKEIKDTLTDFMLNHSMIAPMNTEDVLYFSPEGTRYYYDLNKEGAKMQSSLSKSYGEFYSMLLSALKDQPEEVLTKLSKSKEVITRAIEHKLTWCINTKEVLDLSLKAFEDQLALLNGKCKEKI